VLIKEGTTAAGKHPGITDSDVGGGRHSVALPWPEPWRIMYHAQHP